MLDVKACSARSGRRGGPAFCVSAALLLVATVAAMSCTELKDPIDAGHGKAGADGAIAGSGSGGADMQDPDHPSGDAAVDAASIDGGPTENPSDDCDKEGRLRCSSSNARQRER